MSGAGGGALRLGALWVALAVGALLAGLGVEGNGFDGSLVREVAGERTSALTSAARLATDLGGPALDAVFAVAVAGLLLGRRARDAVFVVVAAGGAMVLTNAIKVVLDRPRPDGGGLVSVASASWPSGHASSSIALYGALAVIAARRATGRPRAAIWLGAAALTAAVGASRVYLGVHYPSDVVAGWLVGGLWLLGVARFAAGAEPTANGGATATGGGGSLPG
ncbi:MAG: phosphatase PAP2 family protein [Solirubrobacteraceae bacterium]